MPTKQIRIERFIDGLVRPLYRVVAPQMKTFPSYLTTVDYARMLEMKEMEARASQEKTKKHKAEGVFSGQSSGTFGKGSKPHARRGTIQWSIGSTGQFFCKLTRE